MWVVSLILLGELIIRKYGILLYNGSVIILTIEVK